VNLPPELAERFSIVEELGSGGEGFVLLVQDAAGAEFVVKLYHPNLAFDDKASSLLVSADRAHVLSMEPGRTADGSRFEVLEWCEPGTLRDLLNDGRRLDVAEVVAELASALEHIHGLRLDGDPDARLVHQDLKPDNVMVRTLEPFDLVLGDFGLARMIAGSRHFTNRQQGSRAWAPPSGEAVTAGWDWWSLGMIVAEVAGGRHPFCVDGEWLSDAAISDHLSQSPVDLSDIDDDRVRTLCRGLLTRRTTDRWGASEVQRWLAGETVRVVADVGGGERRRRTVLFNGTEYAEPVELALALQQDWDQAQERLIQRTDGGALSQQVALLLAAAGLADAESLLKDTDHPPTRLANLLAEMNPDLPPIYRGHDIRPTALLAELTDPKRAAKTVQLIEDPKGGLIATGVATAWRHLEGMDDAPAVQQRMKEARDYVGSVPYAQELLGRDAMLSVRAAAHATAIQPQNADVSRAEVAALDTRQARKQTWWAKVHDDGTSPYAPAVALLTEPAAREQSDKADAKQQAERQEAERKRQAERRAAEQAQREREREQQERERVQRDAEVDQLRRRDLRVIKWAGILLVPGIALGFWRINDQLDGSGQLSQDLGALMEAAPASMFWGALWAGSFAGLGLCALVLLVRGKFGLRQTGVTLMAVMGLLSVGLYFVGLNAAKGSLDEARSSMYSSPVPTSRFDTCRGTSYWTSTSGARRTFVDSDCQTVRSYAGWFESWDHRSSEEISDLNGLGPVYVVRAANGQSFAALSKDSGEQLWDMHCPDGVDLNEEMFDQGAQTPTDQFAAGTCNGQPFIVDPRTGGAP
jgi:serine/threonine protein kinase